MNKKGFTLVELLAVIVILSLLALITSTSITKLVKDSKEDLSDTQIKLIKSAAEAWGADNINMLPDIGECSYLTLRNLKNYGLMDSNIIDPNTKEEISDDLKIKISTTESSYGNPVITYEVNPTSINGCTTVCTITRKVSGAITLGDEVTCGTEKFNILSVNKSTNVVSMLASKAITLTDTPQQSTTPGQINLYSDETLASPYLNAYSNTLKNNVQLSQISSRLIDPAEFGTVIGCTETTFPVGYSCPNAPVWLSNTSNFWTSTKGTYYNANAKAVYLGSYADYIIRPVVEVLSTELY